MNTSDGKVVTETIVNWSLISTGSKVKNALNKPWKEQVQQKRCYRKSYSCMTASKKL